ncbi:hypothetical protein SERLADRAFT_351141, partial [Serpula lacrymans var. lacrymans S7.9]
GRAFQLPHADRWVVYVTDPQLVKEISTIPPNRLSLLEASNDMLQAPYTGIHQEQQIIDIIKYRLVRSWTSIVPTVYEEAAEALSQYIPSTTGALLINYLLCLLICRRSPEWTAVPAFATVSDVTSRIAARMFVGLPKAHDMEYTRLSAEWAHGVINAGVVLNMFPKILRPLVCWIHNPPAHTLKLVFKNIASLIEERKSLLATKDLEKSDRHNDLLSWLIQGDTANAMDPLLITRKLLSVNFATIHTLSSVGTHVLYYLAAHPEYVEPLRAEITSALGQGHGIKHALDHMYTLESFLKESLRFNFIVSMLRKAIQPITLSDGSHLPIGTLLMVSPLPVHMSSELYEDAEVFDGFRFHKAESQSPNQMAIPSLDYFPFGYGSLACPGRLIAVSLLKVLLTHILLGYDIKLQGDTRPADKWIGTLCFPNDLAKIFFRKRVKQ